MNKKPNSTPALFDRDVLLRCRDVIHQEVGRCAQSIITIGLHLIEAKKDCGHGIFMKWIAAEFGWSQSTAHNFMRVAERFGDQANSQRIVNLEPTTLYLLAAPSTPDEIREDIVARINAGEKLQAEAIKSIIKEATGKPTRSNQPATSKAAEIKSTEWSVPPGPNWTAAVTESPSAGGEHLDTPLPFDDPAPPAEAAEPTTAPACQAASHCAAGPAPETNPVAADEGLADPTDHVSPHDKDAPMHNPATCRYCLLRAAWEALDNCDVCRRGRLEMLISELIPEAWDRADDDGRCELYEAVNDLEMTTDDLQAAEAAAPESEPQPEPATPEPTQHAESQPEPIITPAATEAPATAADDLSPAARDALRKFQEYAKRVSPGPPWVGFKDLGEIDEDVIDELLTAGEIVYAPNNENLVGVEPDWMREKRLARALKAAE